MKDGRRVIVVGSRSDFCVVRLLVKKVTAPWLLVVVGRNADTIGPSPRKTAKDTIKVSIADRRPILDVVAGILFLLVIRSDRRKRENQKLVCCRAGIL